MRSILNQALEPRYDINVHTEGMNASAHVAEWIFVLWINDNAKEFLNTICNKFDCNKIVFVCVLDPDRLKKHFRNVVREGWAYHPEGMEWLYCIEILWVVQQ